MTIRRIALFILLGITIVGAGVFLRLDSKKQERIAEVWIAIHAMDSARGAVFEWDWASRYLCSTEETLASVEYNRRKIDAEAAFARSGLEQDAPERTMLSVAFENQRILVHQKMMECLKARNRLIAADRTDRRAADAATRRAAKRLGAEEDVRHAREAKAAACLEITRLGMEAVARGMRAIPEDRGAAISELNSLEADGVACTEEAMGESLR